MSALAFSLVADVQRAGGRAAVVDVAQSFDVSAANAAGVETRALFVSQPADGEEALSISEALLRSRFFDIVVVDGAEALSSSGEPEGLRAARRMAKAIRSIAMACSRADSSCVFTRLSRPGGRVVFGFDAESAVADAISSCATRRLRASSLRAKAGGGRNAA